MHSGVFAIAPFVFVLLWSTGFIGAKFGLPYAEPFTFLALRFFLVSLIFVPVVVLTRASWPDEPRRFLHIVVSGLLVHGVYLGGVFAAISIGVSAGVSALIVGMQPLLTAVLIGPLLGERVVPIQWFGFGLGTVGVTMVIGRELDLVGPGLHGLLLCLLALVGISIGTLYQKRFCSGVDLRSASLIQYFASALFMSALSLIFEDQIITWSGEFLFALTWLTLVLSLGAVTLLWLLIRKGEAANVASLFFLVPPATAIIAWWLFGEVLTGLSLVGMGLAAMGVLVVIRGGAASQS